MTRCCDVRSDGAVLVVTIDRQSRRNALSSADSHELGRVFDEFERNPDYRVAIVTGAGNKAFCAGADLKEAARSPGAATVPESGFGGLTTRFGRVKPVVAAVNGVALGGGFELVLACDVVVAVDHATFGLPEPRVGLAALGGGVQRLTREIGSKRANGVLLTGRQQSAADGMRMGFVNEVVAPADLMRCARSWCADIIACSPASIRATMAIAAAGDGHGLATSMREMWSMPVVHDVVAGPDAREGAAAFAQRRSPRWSAL